MRAVVFLLFIASASARTTFWAPATPPRAAYKIDARISADGSRLDGTETVRFRNDTKRPFGRLAFDFSPTDLKVRVNGAAAVKVEGVQSPQLFELAKEIAPGEQAEITAEFSVPQPPIKDGEGGATYGWYPRLWWGFGTLDEYAVKISAPENLTISASGALRDGVYYGSGIRAFALFAGRGFQVLEGDAGGVQVRAIYRPKGVECARLLLKTAVDAVNFYRDRFGFYPHQSLTIVPGMDYPAGGYPIASAMVAIHGQERMSERQPDWWPWITAHEIGHMYWGDYVLARGPDALDWLMIGLGIRADQEYRRARGIKGAGELWKTYASGVTQGYDTTMDLTDGQEHRIKWDFNNVVTHGKSSAMLNALESVIGKDDFEAVYRQCLRDYGGKQLGWREFQAVAERRTGQDLGWFFDQWVRSPAYAGYKIGSQSCDKAGDGYDCAVTIEKTGTMQMPVAVVAQFEDASTQRLVAERLADKDALRFHSKEAFASVAFDRAVPMPEAPKLSAKDLSERIEDLPWTHAGDEALTLYRELLKPVSPERNLVFKLAMVMCDGGQYPEALEAFERAAQSSPEPSYRFAALVWQGHVLDLMGKRAEAVARYEAALKVEGTPSMRHSQYNMTVNKAWVQERLKTPYQR